MSRFEFQVRVYYEDTDAEGVVYYANYLKFLERARSEWLRHHDLPVRDLAQNHNLIFVVKRMEIDYVSAAKLDDLLNVSVEVSGVSKAAFVLNQSISSCKGKTVCKAVLKMACLDAVRFKPVRIPGKINQLIEKETN